MKIEIKIECDEIEIASLIRDWRKECSDDGDVELSVDGNVICRQENRG